MHNKIFYVMLLSTALGIIGGIFFPEQMLNIKWIDALFIGVLKLIVIPLVFSAVVSAVISMGSIKRLKSIWVYTLGYVLISTGFAVSIGLVFVNLFNPGEGVSATLITLHVSPSQLETLISSSSFFKTLLPSSKINSASTFEIIPIILFSVIFGIACISVGETAKPLVALLIALRNVFSKIILWLMFLTPIGLFALLGSAIAEAYTRNILMESIHGLAIFIILFLFGLLCQFLWQYAVIKYLVKRNPRKFLTSSIKAMLVAFATSSSLATLPTTLIIAKEEQIDQDIADFVLPFTSTINLSATAMYEAVSVLFFCQVLGMHLSILSQVGVFFISIVAGIGAAGIPEGGLITLLIILKSVNVPASAIILLLPFDRILDRLRSMVNVWGDLVCVSTVNYFMLRGKTVANDCITGSVEVRAESETSVLQLPVSNHALNQESYHQ